MIKNINCIICPLSCEIKIHIKGQSHITKISGYKCKKGKIYAKEEIISPKRILTTTMLTSDKYNPLVSVKTDKPLPKKLLFKIIKILNKKKLKAPVKIGQIIIKNVLNTGADIVSTSSI